MGELVYVSGVGLTAEEIDFLCAWYQDVDSGLSGQILHKLWGALPVEVDAS